MRDETGGPVSYSVAFTAAIPAPRSSDGDGTAICFSVYNTTYAPAPTSGSAHHTFGLAHQLYPDSLPLLSNLLLFRFCSVN